MSKKIKLRKYEVAETWQGHEIRRSLVRKLAARLNRRPIGECGKQSLHIRRPEAGQCHPD